MPFDSYLNHVSSQEQNDMYHQHFTTWNKFKLIAIVILKTIYQCCRSVNNFNACVNAL